MKRLIQITERLYNKSSHFIDQSFKHVKLWVKLTSRTQILSSKESLVFVSAPKRRIFEILKRVDSTRSIVVDASLLNAERKKEVAKNWDTLKRCQFIVIDRVRKNLHSLISPFIIFFSENTSHHIFTHHECKSLQLEI